MSYSLTRLQTKAECDQLISIAKKAKRTLEAREKNLGVRQENLSEHSQEDAAELTGVNSELDSLNIYIAGLPEGKSKKSAEKKQKRLELKQYLLTTKKEEQGPVNLLEQEFDLALIEKQLDEADAFIAAMEAQKAALAA